MTTKRTSILILSSLLAVGALLCGYSVWNAYQVNGTASFPLDDPWIHLQFAKNLHDFGSFSYYKNEHVTSGSTSPLYTILLALGFLVTGDEIVLSYCLGVLFFLAAAFYYFKLALREFDGSALIAAVAATLLLFEPRLQWVALSGMETTLFLFLLIAVTYFYRMKKAVAFGVVSGLLLWTRPEAILFFVVLTLDGIYHKFLVKAEPSRQKSKVPTDGPHSWLKRAMVITSLFGVTYAAFNFALSGSLLPNTYAAKVRYYAGGNEEFPGHVFHFFADGHLSILSFFLGVGMLRVFIMLVRRKPCVHFISLVWAIGLFLAYWDKLPYLYHEGRYMMPALPFVIMLGLSGVSTVLDVGKKYSVPLGKRWIPAMSTVLLLVFTVQFAAAAWKMKATYAESCKYINDRQVRTARWLHDNLPRDAVIATHDVGAIAFYSGRRIADMVGLISPGMIESIGSFDKLKRFLLREKATHIAVLRNWFEIANQNPIFQTDERYPEIMEVFEFNTGRIQFIPQDATRIMDVAAHYLSTGDARRAALYLEQSLRAAPQSSRNHLLAGKVLMSLDQLDAAEQEFRTALRLHQDFWEARLALAEVAAKHNQPGVAIAQLDSVIQRNPSYAPGYRALAEVYQAFRLDTVKASQYYERFTQLSHGAAR